MGGGLGVAGGVVVGREPHSIIIALIPLISADGHFLLEFASFSSGIFKSGCGRGSPVPGDGRPWLVSPSRIGKSTLSLPFDVV